MQRQATPDELKKSFEENEAKIKELQDALKGASQEVQNALNQGLQTRMVLRLQLQAVYGFATMTNFTVDEKAPEKKKKGRPKLHAAPEPVANEAKAGT